MSDDPESVRLKKFVRRESPGGCRWFSSGLQCDCLLCAIDRLQNKINKLRAEQKAKPVVPDCQRYNFDADDDGILVCRKEHSQEEPCEFERLTPHETLELIQQMRAESIAMHSIVRRFVSQVTGATHP